MWDNRESKKKPTHPDYKCKSRSCDHAIWLERKGGGGRGGERGAAKPTGPLAPVYGECVEIASRAITKYCKAVGLTPTASDIVAGAATIFIQAAQSGRPIVKAAPAPRPKPAPPPPPEPEDYPDEAPDEELPF